MTTWEEWQLDMIRGGDAPEEWTDALGEPAEQARLARFEEEARAVEERLYRATCPDSLVLGEYHLGLLSATSAAALSRHLEGCALCQEDLAAMRPLLDTPLIMPQDAEPDGVLRRVVVSLRRLFQDGEGGTGLPSPVLRGSAKTRHFAGEAYRVSLTTTGPENSMTLTGLIASGEVEGRATLRGGNDTPRRVMIDESGVFRFEHVTPGVYDLILELPASDLLSESLELPF